MRLGHNERSWAADLISEINSYAATHKLSIRRAGGEYTLKQSGAASLFPDVILFGGDDGTLVRHGWELKYPDTPVDDPATVNNAIDKAERLGVNSFVIWNVRVAHLHVKDDSGQFNVEKSWGPLEAHKREDVEGIRAEWTLLLATILDDLNRFFATGKLTSAPPSFLQDRFFIDFLATFAGITADSLRAAAQKSAKVEAQFQLWWESGSDAFRGAPGQPVDYSALAQAVIVGWINRLLFCHYLKAFRQEATDVDMIEGSMTLSEGMAVLDGVSARCDFMQVFRREPGAELIPDEAWEGLKGLNAFIKDFAVNGIPQDALRLALEGALNAAKRKVRGQFTTPDQLADLLVALGMEDREGCLLDPCCGTGTIPKAAVRARLKRGQSPGQALSAVWAADRFQFPLQFTTMALAEPQAISVPLRVFQADVFSLVPGKNIEFAHPDNGAPVHEVLPSFSTIASNLPFIRFETLTQHDPDLRARFLESVPDGHPDAKSDLFAYIILYLKALLTSEGRVAVIVSNAWLGTDWGANFRALLARDFEVDTVVVSGKGRWFSNADVVTTILVLRRKTEAGGSLPTRFVTTLKPVEQWDDAIVASLSADLHGHVASIERAGSHRIRSYTPAEMSALGGHLIGWPGFFAKIDWIEELAPSLVPAKDLLKVARGERRGWDPLFYPEAGHGIEDDYIRPVLKSARGARRLTLVADGEAFCCARDVDDLRKRGHTGAIKWIKRFENASNDVGKPLVRSLARSDHHWYEMKPDATADFAIAMNPEDYVFTIRMSSRSFVNQRLIRLSRLNDDHDPDLLHALLNSSLSIFMIESSGFGRGLGALDITPTKLQAGMKLVDPASIEAADKATILGAFKSLLTREVLPLDQEMLSADRIVLDEAILRTVGKEHLGVAIRDSVRELYQIRKAVKR